MPRSSLNRAVFVAAGAVLWLAACGSEETCVDTNSCGEPGEDSGADTSSPEGAAGTGGTGATGGSTMGGAAGTSGSAGTSGGAGATQDAGGDASLDGGVDAGGCPTGTADCNGLASDGCEVNLADDVNHCGACGRACSMTGASATACVGAVCAPTCSPGADDCTTPIAPAADNGCEADLQGDENNCGACGRVCSATNTTARACAAGDCAPTCETGFDDCATPAAPTPDDGCEVDLQTDLSHCGACGRVCSAANTTARACTAGACAPTCASGFDDCATPAAPTADDGCEVSIATDPYHCGECGRQCSSAGASSRGCSGGACAPTCQSDRGDCATPAAPAPDDGCEVNTTNDAAHCGSCDHSCLGGACSTSMCQPVTIASAQNIPTDVAVNTTHIYWSTIGGTGSVHFKAIDNSGAIGDVMTGGGGVWAIDLDGTHVYYSVTVGSTPGIYRAALASSGMDTVRSMAGEAYRAIALTPTHVYYGGAVSQGIRRVSIVGASSGTAALQDAGVAEDLVAAGSSVLWATNVAGTLGVRRGPQAATGAPALVLDSALGSTGVAANDSHLYYVMGTAIKRVPHLSATPASIHAHSSVGNRIAIDATHIYWTTQAGEVMRVPLGGGTAVPLVTGLTTPGAITLDANAIYYVETAAGGGVYKLAK